MVFVFVFGGVFGFVCGCDEFVFCVLSVGCYCDLVGVV